MERMTRRLVEVGEEVKLLLELGLGLGISREIEGY